MTVSLVSMLTLIANRLQPLAKLNFPPEFLRIGHYSRSKIVELKRRTTKPNGISVWPLLSFFLILLKF